MLNLLKTFQVIFKAPNKRFISTDYEVQLGNHQLCSKNSTNFLGIEIDDNLIFNKHITEICKKFNFILLLMRSIRPLDRKTSINIYYTFFCPHLIYGIEFWGQAADRHLNKIYILQKSALRIILKIPPRGHVLSKFNVLKIMPVKMLFEYRFLLLFLNSSAMEDVFIQRRFCDRTRSKDVFKILRVNNHGRGERSLACAGVRLFNKYLSGVEAGTPCGLQSRLACLMWASGVGGGAE